MGPCVLREPCFPWHSGATRHNTDAICKMGRSRACTVLPFSEAGARSIKLRHFSPLKEKHCFRRQELGGVALPSLSDWGSCPHSQPSLCRTSGWSHTRMDISLCLHPAQPCCAQGLDFPWDCSPLVRNLGYRERRTSFPG